MNQKTKARAAKNEHLKVTAAGAITLDESQLDEAQGGGQCAGHPRCKLPDHISPPVIRS